MCRSREPRECTGCACSLGCCGNESSHGGLCDSIEDGAHIDTDPVSTRAPIVMPAGCSPDAMWFHRPSSLIIFSSAGSLTQLEGAGLFLPHRINLAGSHESRGMVRCTQLRAGTHSSLHMSASAARDIHLRPHCVEGKKLNSEP